MTPTQKLLSGISLSIIAGCVLFWIGDCNEQESGFEAYEIYLGRRLAQLSLDEFSGIHEPPQPKQVLILCATSWQAEKPSVIDAARIAGIRSELEDRRMDTDLLVHFLNEDPLMAQKGEPVDHTRALSKILRPDPVVTSAPDLILSLLASPPTVEALRASLPEPRPLVMFMTARTESVQPLLDSGLAQAAIVSRVDQSQPDEAPAGDPLHRRFQIEYRILRGRKVN